MAYQDVKVPDYKEAGRGQFWKRRKSTEYRNKINSRYKEVKKKVCNLGVMLTNV